jgi:hypothetical protein
MSPAESLRAKLIEVDGDFDTVNDYYEARGWSDGLPLVPPTEQRVGAMLEQTDLDPEHFLGTMPPLWAPVTVEHVAINAVMAGCRPAYFPVVLAAIEAVLDPAYNLYAVQATTNPVTPLVLINGPIRKELNLNAGAGCLGPGWRANATIGRALRLCMLNLGGAAPGPIDKATQGQPGKFSFCTAENEEENPWGPFHVHRGFSADDSTVTLLAPTGTQNMIDSASATAAGLLMTFVSAMSYVGSNNVFLAGEPTLLLGPEHAARLHQGGLDRTALCRFLYDHARVPLQEFSPDLRREFLERRRTDQFLAGVPDHYAIPLTDAPENFHIVVAGGPGQHSIFMPSFGGPTKAVTVRIKRKS